MFNLKDYLNNLGRKATDKVSGAKGVIQSVSFDLYGCIQYNICPVDKKGKFPRHSYWLDVARVELSDKHVMTHPFDKENKKPHDKGGVDHNSARKI